MINLMGDLMGKIVWYSPQIFLITVSIITIVLIVLAARRIFRKSRYQLRAE